MAIATIDPSTGLLVKPTEMGETLGTLTIFRVAHSGRNSSGVTSQGLGST